MLSKLKGKINLCIILGSGQADIICGEPVGKNMLFKKQGKTGILIITKRRHLYEGFPVEKVIDPVKTAFSLGAKIQVLTNAAGAVSKRVNPGNIMLIKDHINLMLETPLKGPDFLSLHDCYDADLRKETRNLFDCEGVYAGVRGPSYETKAEVKMLEISGADAVGMSTVPEAIAAKRLGMKVLAFSLITNRAGEKSSHDEVLKAANKAHDKIAKLIEKVILRITNR